MLEIARVAKVQGLKGAEHFSVTFGFKVSYVGQEGKIVPVSLHWGTMIWVPGTF